MYEKYVLEIIRNDNIDERALLTNYYHTYMYYMLSLEI